MNDYDLDCIRTRMTGATFTSLIVFCHKVQSSDTKAMREEIHQLNVALIEARGQVSKLEEEVTHKLQH